MGVVSTLNINLFWCRGFLVTGLDLSVNVFITLLHSSQETHTVVIQDYFDDKTHGLFLD